MTEKSLILAAAFAAAMLAYTPAHAVGPDGKKPAASAIATSSTDCAALLKRIDGLEMDFAISDVAGMSDDSAARETNRQLREIFGQQREQMYLSLMVNLKCPLIPFNHISGGHEYLTAALKCDSEKKPGQPPTEMCMSNNWVPSRDRFNEDGSAR